MEKTVKKTDYKIDYKQAAKYIDLKVNGRLFPSWILANFKAYNLPEIIRTTKDPCSDVKKDEFNELRRYQLFLSKYLDYRSPYRDILIYHGLGSGKTASAINIYNILYNYTSGWNVFLLIKASLKGNWLNEIKQWLSKDEFEFRFKNIIFINYDAPNADKSFMEAMKNIDRSKKSMYVIDEVHNFIRNVYGNIVSGGSRAQIIYDYIVQDKRDNPDTRVVLLSGTPAINHPFELAILFNLLRPGTFPKSEARFNDMYVSTASYSQINQKNKNMFQRRIMGLVSYYIGATPDLYATRSRIYVDVPMSKYQQEVYVVYEEIERKIEAKAKFVKESKGSTVYKTYTRQACNFVFPPISQQINGETRPRPGKFRISEREAEKLMEGSLKELKKEKESALILNVEKYYEAMTTFINELIKFFKQHNDNDVKAGHTVMKDVKTFITEYEGDFRKFDEASIKKSSLYEQMRKCSGKMVEIIFNVMKSPGPTVVYSNYVKMEGLEIFKIYLSFFGFYSWMKTKELVPNQLGYVEFHGDIKPVELRYEGMKVFNAPENKLGDKIKIILVSSAGSEGLSLENVRQMHIMEPYWNEVRITQMEGRGVRQCSHKDLSIDDRHVDIYRYRSVLSSTSSVNAKESTDQIVEGIARTKDGLIQSFLDAIKEVAVDCVLNKKHNMMMTEYKCFQFEEPSLFDKHIGPAYREDVNDDVKFDNGLNSTDTTVKKIKVVKIKAVKLLSAPDLPLEELKYSNPQEYWLYPESGVVYDFELDYPVGKIAQDQNGLPFKLDKETYVMDYVIPIPIIEEN